MLASSPTVGSSPNFSPHFRRGILGGWLLFTLMVIAITWGGAVVRGRPLDLGGTVLWNLGWLLWAGATFAVAWLARRIPLERGRLARGLALHVACGIVVGFALLGVEFLFGQAVQSLWAGAPRANAFLGFIVYKFHVYFLIYWMILGATRAHDSYAKLRASELHASQLAAQLAQSQLHTLQAQLHPHFLFNTHHAIVSLMLKGDNPAAIRMLTQLSDLLRVTLRRTDQQLSSVRDELEALELYLGIQRERYGDRLALQLDVDPAAHTAEVPWLLLQPLVENALKHGIDPLSAAGLLHIRVHARDGQLQVTVSDNGAGFAPTFSIEHATGIGLRNTAARLARLYGDAHRLQFGTAPSGGAEVRIMLPLRPYVPLHD